MRIAFLTNILTPYRIHFYDTLNDLLTKRDGALKVFAMTDSLPLRPWTYCDFMRDYTELLAGQKIFIRGNDYLFNPGVTKKIMEFEPDFLIIAGSWTYPTFCQAVFSARVGKCCKRFLWTESHNHTGINNASKKSGIIKRIKTHIFSRFDGFCIPGSYAEEMINDLISTAHKTMIRLPNLVDDSFYYGVNELRKDRKEQRNKRGISQDLFVFITPARFVSLKGIVPFLESVRAVKNIDKALFVFAGGGPEKKKIEKVAKNSRINVRMYDYQSPEEIREWLAISDAFLLPSLSDANPLSSIEAAWSGLPLCLSKYVGNGPELVDPGINGVIFDTLDQKDVARKIEFVLEQGTEWSYSAGQVSLSKAERDFNTVNETERFIKALEKCERKKKWKGTES